MKPSGLCVSNRIISPRIVAPRQPDRCPPAVPSGADEGSRAGAAPCRHATALQLTWSAVVLASPPAWLRGGGDGSLDHLCSDLAGPERAALVVGDGISSDGGVRLAADRLRLELLDTAAEGVADLGQLAGPKDDHDDDEDNQQFLPAKAQHGPLPPGEETPTGVPRVNSRNGSGSI